MESNLSRREFLRKSAGATLAATVGGSAIAAPTILQQKARGANDRIRISVFGMNGRGNNHVQEFMKIKNVEVVNLCDPDLDILSKRKGEFKQKYNKEIATEQNMFKVLEDKTIDVISLATPNHWHALQTVYACQAGKDVYVEKPATHNIAEGKKIIEASYKYDRIVQHGVQLRSAPAIREAIQHLRDGVIGNVYMARGLVFRWRPDIGIKPNEPVPAGLDYDLWCGPARMKPFSRNHVHYNWHWTYEYGNGDTGNQGIHETDLCMWGLGVDKLPERITSMGGKFLWNDAKEHPEVQTSLYHYPTEKKMIQFEVRHWCTNLEDGAGVGNIFYGDKGYMVIRGYDEYETFLGEKREPGPKGKQGGDHYHFENFIEAVRKHDRTIQNGSVESGHLSSALAHLGSISCKLNRVLNFDNNQEQFIGDQEANTYLTRKYRAPYLMPDKI